MPDRRCGGYQKIKILERKDRMQREMRRKEKESASAWLVPYNFGTRVLTGSNSDTAIDAPAARDYKIYSNGLLVALIHQLQPQSENFEIPD